jgi:hypothetical protein
MKMCYIKEAIKVVSRPPAAEEAKKKITPAEENNAAEKIAETTDPPKAAPKQITAPVVSHQAVSSLSDLEAKLRAQKEAMKVVVVKEEIIPTAVDEEKAKELIATFAENMRQSGNVGVAGMLESAPCTVEFNKLQFAAASDIQKTLIEKEMPTMLDFLRREMSNPSILAEVLVDEVQSKSRNSIFTPKDKLDAMIRNNPNVQTLIEKLGLDLEY